MIKLAIGQILKPVQIISILCRKKKSRQTMMRAYLNIKGKKFCAIYNNKGIRYE